MDFHLLHCLRAWTSALLQILRQLSDFLQILRQRSDFLPISLVRLLKCFRSLVPLDVALQFVFLENTHNFLQLGTFPRLVYGWPLILLIVSRIYSIRFLYDAISLYM